MAGKAAGGSAPGGRVTGMSVTADAATMRTAIARDGGLCVTCGRPCQAGEARRRIVADRAPDDPMNWVAMCWGCQEALAGRLPPPARFVYRVHNTARWRAELRRRVFVALMTLTIVSIVALSLALGWLIHLGVQGLSQLMFAVLASAVLLGSAWKVYEAWHYGMLGPVHRIHHSHDPQTVTVKEDR